MRLSRKRRAELMASPYTRLLADHEEAIAQLYNCFASILSEASAFWRQLAEEEMIHKRIINMIESKLVSGEWEFQMPFFNTANIAESIDWVNGMRERMEYDGVTMNMALEKAHAIENSILETRYFELIESPNAEAQEELTKLRDYTREHLKRVEDEMKRIKWKILGNKNHKPEEVQKKIHQTPVCDTPALHSKIKAAQANLLELMVSLEDTAAQLYTTYSRLLPDYEKMWSRLAAEEMQHAAMLRKLHSWLEKDTLFNNLGHFNKEEIENQIERILDKEYVAQKKGITQAIAINNALELERYLVEADFYKSVGSDSPEYQVVAKRMVELSIVHKKQLETAIIELNQNR